MNQDGRDNYKYCGENENRKTKMAAREAAYW